MANTKMLFSVVAVAAVGGFAYYYFRKQCADAAGAQSFPMICGWINGQPVAAAPTSSTTPADSTAPNTQHATNPNPPITPTDPWALALAGMKSAAGGNSLNFDQWSYYFQDAPKLAGAPTGYGEPGSITPQIMDALITLGGGDRTKLIAAEDFLGFYRHALQNAGLSGMEIPTWLIHRGAFA